MLKTADAKKQCALGLKKVVKLLVAEDRKRAMAKFNISYVTISRYLSGKIGNLVLGINLLNYFKSRVHYRVNRVRRIMGKKAK